MINNLKFNASVPFAFSFFLVILSLTAHVNAQETRTAEKDITVFVARQVITMNPAWPMGTHVAVRDGKILSVGRTFDDLKPWLAGKKYRVNNDFKTKVLMPGFIDPHMHPMLGAIQFGTHWITPEPWNIMGEKIPATIGRENYLRQLKKVFDSDTSPASSLFITWGYHELFHGKLTKADLDNISKTRPIMVWQRSVHEAYFNTAAMSLFVKAGLSKDKVTSNSQIDWDNGYFMESGFFNTALPVLAPLLLDKTFVDSGMQKTRNYLLANGVTTVGEMATGSTNWALEIAAMSRTFDVDSSPLRIRLTPDVDKMAIQLKTDDRVQQFIEKARSNNTRHIILEKSIKLFTDGAYFSQLMKIRDPGYIDGHKGEWIQTPARFEALARRYWNAGYNIHVHTNGDGGLEVVLDTVEKLRDEKPRTGTRFVVEHFGYSSADQVRRIANLGVLVSANPFYLYDMGDMYTQVGLGHDRVARIAALGGLVREGVSVALHSDFAMAPAAPLELAWTAVTRQTQSGKVYGESERLTIDQAMKAITIDAAYILNMEDRIGSIEAGKFADFTVLEQSPYEVKLKNLRSIKIWGVIFEGQPFPAPKYL